LSSPLPPPPPCPPPVPCSAFPSMTNLRASGSFCFSLNGDRAACFRAYLARPAVGPERTPCVWEPLTDQCRAGDTISCDDTMGSEDLFESSDAIAPGSAGKASPQSSDGGARAIAAMAADGTAHPPLSVALSVALPQAEASGAGGVLPTEVRLAGWFVVGALGLMALFVGAGAALAVLTRKRHFRRAGGGWARASTVEAAVCEESAPSDTASRESGPPNMRAWPSPALGMAKLGK